MNRQIKEILFSILGIIILGAGVAMMMKANVGLAAWDMVAATIGHIFKIKEGTGSIIANIVLFIAQIFILRKSFKKSQYLQVFVILFFGLIINFFLYDIFKFSLDTYMIRLLAFIMGNMLTSLGVSILVLVNFITMPVEAFSGAVALKTRFTFNQVRLSIDIICLILCTVLTLILNLPPTLREGTFISMVIFNGLLKFFMNILEKTSLVEVG